MVAERSEAESGPVRRRPKDRKLQIMRAAARAFSQRGYHPVGVDEIAAEVGISGPALYRHFANKYALLVAAAEEGARDLRDSAAAADDPSLPPLDRLTALLTAVAERDIDIRREAGLYRWERRYLEREDRHRIRAYYRELEAMVGAPIAELRPSLSETEVAMRAVGALSVLASISAHRSNLPQARTLALMLEMAMAVIFADLPPEPPEGAAEPGQVGLTVSSKREQLLTEAMRIFGRNGYHESAIEEIGAAVGINASSVYRYFDSKADLLLAAFNRASDRITLAIEDALREATDRPDAARRIADRFVRLTFMTPELMPVYYAEFGSLPPAEQHRLRALQRQTVLEWANLLDGDPIEARFRVHAALGIIIDVGRLLRFDSRPAQLARMGALASSVLSPSVS
ncbi:TetR/AcrR family transcriptional regulator [Nocardia camponoti]|uniref:TetR family transcriptional regulator n=1 Tax=Nocardia camponoti TaxID=1616106 RepID=A0A917VBN1_9NOCA|nr:TetR/AcrR family transcriptional regulator [Nocardia camponoti]GGK58068.1 TetR family transcriptional regulator [Nocardia camponoti]